MTLLEHTGRRALHADPGEIISVLGAPGSGKTALALELAFLTRPGEGEVLFKGSNPLKRRRSVAARPREVTMLVQNAEDQLFARTVFDDVAFGPRRLLLEEDEVEERVHRAVEAVGLDQAAVLGRSPFALSGGERRRVALAGVLAMEPEVLILDEPTSNLDPRTRHEFSDLLEPLRGKAAIVWLSSSAAEAARADRIYLLRDDETWVVGGDADLLRDWRRLAAGGIELPAVYTLAADIEQRGHLLPDVPSAADLEQAIIDDWRRASHA